MKYHLWNRVGECDPFKRGINWSWYRYQDNGYWMKYRWSFRIELFHKFTTTSFRLSSHRNHGLSAGVSRNIGGWEYPQGTYFSYHDCWVFSKGPHDEVARRLRKDYRPY